MGRGRPSGEGMLEAAFDGDDDWFWRNRTGGCGRQAQARVESLLSAALSADSAVQVMLLNNRALQAENNALGGAEADYVEATLPPAPVFTLELLWGAGFFDTERRLIANVLALATLPCSSAWRSATASGSRGTVSTDATPS